MLGRLVNLAHQPHLPRRTVRLRLTVLYGALFLLSGAALLAITYVLVSRSTGDLVFLSRSTTVAPPALEAPAGPPGGPGDLLPERMRDEAERMRAQASEQRAEQLDQLVVQSGIALGLMSVVSIGLGWVVAGRVLGPLRTMTATTRQISERNLHERLALEGPSDELKDLGDTIDGLLGRLETAFDAQRRFVANASHELRTPLSMMRTSLDVAAAKPGAPSPEASALDGKLREGLNRADRLLEDFLTLARAQDGPLPERTTVSLAGVVAATIADRGDAILERGLAIRTDLGEADVVGSRTLLSHMVANVVENAVLHNEPSGWVRVETLADDAAHLVVETGGPRLEQSQVSELAQPFRRLGADRIGSENGSGLGLSIVAAIATAHGGELELRARPGGGLRVLIELPRAPAGLPARELA